MSRTLRVLIAADKFRGSLTATKANAAIAAGLAQSSLQADARCLALGDGGEGTRDALATPDTVTVRVPIHDPFATPVTGTLLWDAKRRRAVVEMAEVAGHNGTHDPDRASSHPVGEMIRAALDRGAREVVVAAGGSITVDGGAGALAALGARLLDAAGAPLTVLAGRNLSQVAQIDFAGLDPRLRDLTIVLAADVSNPLTGPEGAAAVFGPQKGVRPDDIGAFDAALGHFDAVLAQTLARASLAPAASAGAAGGIMIGLAAAAPTVARDGFDLVAEHHDLATTVCASDLVVTGEGSLDTQSLAGKGPVALARMARDAGRPAIAFTGRLAVDPDRLAHDGVAAAFAIADGPQTLEAALAGADAALTRQARNVFTLIALGQNFG